MITTICTDYFSKPYKLVAFKIAENFVLCQTGTEYLCVTDMNVRLCVWAAINYQLVENLRIFRILKKNSCKKLFALHLTETNLMMLVYLQLKIHAFCILGLDEGCWSASRSVYFTYGWNVD